MWQRCHVLCSARDQILSKHSLKLLVLQGNIWSVCQIKLQHFALVRKTTLVTAVFWLLWLTYKSLWPQGLAGCSLTLSSHNPALFFFFSCPLCLCMFLRICMCLCGSKTGKCVPEFLLCIWKTLRNKVDRLVRLVLIGLHCRSLWLELPGLWFIREWVLD